MTAEAAKRGRTQGRAREAVLARWAKAKGRSRSDPGGLLADPAQAEAY